MIPKIIHYCWFGEKRKPALVRKCILSWKKKLPDYKLIEWNEKNSDLSHSFVNDAYINKNWAFVSDYVRLKVIYQFGGIYLDTDMLILETLNKFLSHKCFLVAENNTLINGAIIGAVPKHRFIEKCITSYNFRKFNSKNLNEIKIPNVITEIFNEENQQICKFNLIVDNYDITIYTPEYFYPLPYDQRNNAHNFESYLTSNSYGIHFWNASWITFSDLDYLRNGNYSKGLQIIFKKFLTDRKISLKYIRKILSAIKESLLL
jgi:mannosyltransferase OCH1-like enzyme